MRILKSKKKYLLFGNFHSAKFPVLNLTCFKNAEQSYRAVLSFYLIGQSDLIKIIFGILIFGMDLQNFSVDNTGTCFIQKIYAPSSSVLQGKHLPFTLPHFASIFFAYL
jgi:hypothetical protein